MTRTTLCFSFLLLCLPVGVYAACGEELEGVRRELDTEEQGIRTTEQAVRAAKAEFLSRDAALREVMAHPPAGYDQNLASHLVELRRTEVEPKRAMLERLRAQHEEGRKQWERGHQMLYSQFVQARTALQEQRLSQDDYCRVREAYVQALRMYRDGMQAYRAGMDLYARALTAYAERFLVPYAQGFSDREQWVRLTRQLERGDFLQDLLVPMTANAVRSAPPEAPPE